MVTREPLLMDPSCGKTRVDTGGLEEWEAVLITAEMHFASKLPLGLGEVLQRDADKKSSRLTGSPRGVSRRTPILASESGAADLQS